MSAGDIPKRRFHSWLVCRHIASNHRKCCGKFNFVCWFVLTHHFGDTSAHANNILIDSLGYGACQKVLANAQRKKTIDELSSLSNAIAGVMAAFFSSFTLCPTELVKCKLQSLREMKVNVPLNRRLKIEDSQFRYFYRLTRRREALQLPWST